jgi:outer membrane protein
MKKEVIMNKTAVVLAVSALGFFAQDVMAEPLSPWLVRARVVNIAPADKSDQVGGTGASDRLTVAQKTIPEVDISYFFSPNVAAELILTYPQKHDVSLDGAKIGSFKHLPPTLTVQYHFLPESQVNPYLGVGINYTRISNVNLLNGTANLEHSSVGLALQAGIDFKIDEKWSINVDVKKLRLGSDLLIGGAKVSALKIDPVLVGVGVGYRF